MALVSFVGKQIKRAKKMTLTIGTAAVDGPITITVGGTKAIAVTPTTTNTTTTAAEVAAACTDTGDGEFDELTFSASGAVMTVLGPEDGAPFTLTRTDGGSNATTLATPVLPLSPHDLADVL